MKRLIDNGLMFGNLIEVSSPALVERYNRALQASDGEDHEADGFPHRPFGLFAGDRG